MTQVRTGDVVRVHFTGWLAGGAMFGTSRDREPIEFTAGGDQVLQGMSRAVLGMAVGEKKNFTLSPEEAFGPRRPELKYQVRRSQLPEEVKVGDQVVARGGDGRQVPVWVRELGADHAVLDGNHPLAGQALTFDIEVVSVEEPAAGR
jgi:peptidylprolyl isomerase